MPPTPSMPPAAKRRFRPVRVALFAGAVVGLTLVIAALDTPGQRVLLAAAPPIALLTGMLTGALYASRFRSAFVGLAIGLLIGEMQSLQLFGWQVYGSFALTVANLFLFGLIGLVIGAFVEFVQILHFVAHGGTLKDYRRN